MATGIEDGPPRRAPKSMPMIGTKQVPWMPKPLIVLSGSEHMKLRRPGVTVEDERGNSVSFFQLEEMAELEGRK